MSLALAVAAVRPEPARAASPASPSQERQLSLVVTNRPGRPSLGAPCTIEEAMERFVSGDESAYSLVYTLCAPGVHRTLVRLTGQASVAEDLTQETLLRVYVARATWRPGARVLPWVRAIARRLFLDRLRRIRCEAAAHELFTDTATAGEWARPDVHLAARRMLETVSSTVARLPPGQREAFRLIGDEGLTLSEACQRLGDTNLAVRLRVHRARRALEIALADH